MTGKIVFVEALVFGLGRLVDAANALGVKPVLFTRDRSLYLHELRSSACKELQVEDLDTFDVEAMVVRAREIGAIGLVNLTDTWSIPAIEVADHLGFPGQVGNSVRVCRNKTEMRNRLHAAGLSAGPAFAVARDCDRAEMERKLHLPAIVKERSGTGSRNIWLCKDIGEYRSAIVDALDRIGLEAVTVEPYFQGTLYSAETVTHNAETRLLALSGRLMSPEPHFREDYVIAPLPLDEGRHDDLLAWVRRVLAAVGYENGIAHLEFVETGAGREVIEINPRLGGSLLGEILCRSYATNIYSAFIEMALGRRPSLLDCTLTVHRCFAQRFLYGSSSGTLIAVVRPERLGRLPGRPEYFEVLPAGRKIDHCNDSRGRVGILLASGDNSTEATVNVSAAGNTFTVKVNPSFADIS